MLYALVLVCSLNQPCAPETARVVLPVPDRFASPVTCALTGQTKLAESAVELGPDEYVRVTCRPYPETSR